MKGKGKGQGQQQSPGWGNPNASKGKGKGQYLFQKGAWTPGKGGWGKGKSAYGLEDDWSEGYSGYSFQQGYGVEDTALFQITREAKNEWLFPNPKKTCKPTCHRGLSSLDLGQEQACGKGCSNLVVNGRYAALAGSQDQYDLGIPLPMMMLQDEGDVPPSMTTKPTSSQCIRSRCIGPEQACKEGRVQVTQSSAAAPEHRVEKKS